MKAVERLKILKDQLADIIKKNKLEEESLKKKKATAEIQLREATDNYDIQMERKTTERNELEVNKIHQYR